ncbi:hypothetical protein [Micromonospora chokoriensis]|uniref:Uncharacterized protein n=1 Tax=Micromonospora chokoriensis TaxID=356851 RepID=A0A1C4W8E2_9ACTN|nr:hypothetical protein [Micromonospora chokoriensis]SCE92462.1 hypothetical protein GA0070612_2234 [Micromonospora chokoriensis]
MTELKPGDLLLIGAACSVQFADDRELRLRLVSVDPRPTYQGWVWLTGYVLNDKGLAVDKREVFVQQAGLRVLRAAPALTPAPRTRAPRSAPAPGKSPTPDRSASVSAATPGKSTRSAADRLAFKETGVST